MAGVILPFVPSVPDYQVGTVLDGTPYLFDMRWNARASSWYMGIRDVDGDAIRVGLRVVLGTMLGRRCIDPRFPAGVLFAVDTSGRGVDAGLDDLGTRVLVYFYTFAEYGVLIGG